MSSHCQLSSRVTPLHSLCSSERSLSPNSYYTIHTIPSGRQHKLIMNKVQASTQWCRGDTIAPPPPSTFLAVLPDGEIYHHIMEMCYVPQSDWVI